MQFFVLLTSWECLFCMKIFITLAFNLYTALSKEEMITPWVGVDFSSLLRIHFGKSQKQEDENS